MCNFSFEYWILSSKQVMRIKIVNGRYSPDLTSELMSKEMCDSQQGEVAF